MRARDRFAVLLPTCLGLATLSALKREWESYGSGARIKVPRKTVWRLFRGLLVRLPSRKALRRYATGLYLDSMTKTPRVAHRDG